MFIQVVLENGYFETDESGQGTLLFGNFDLGPMEAVYVESSGNWAFGFNNDVSDSFAIYNAIRDDIYSKCTFKQLVRNNGRFVACYTCPNTTYKGLIGCANESEKSYVMYFSQKFIDNLVE